MSDNTAERDELLGEALEAFCVRLVEGHPQLPTGRSWQDLRQPFQNKIKADFIGPLHAAAAVLTKPRTVTTVEELDALPFESVIRDAGGHVLERWGGPEEHIWGTIMVPQFIPRGDIAFPATVLHVGGAE